MIRISIIANSRIYRDGLAQFLDRIPSFSVAATTVGDMGWLDRIRDLKPDVVLVDFMMTTSLKTIRRVTISCPECSVVAVGVPETETEIIACAEAGAVGYVTREASLPDLVHAISCAVRGELKCSPRIARAMARRLSATTATRPEDISPLTVRERQLGQLLAQGLSNKEIATELHLCVSTVKVHVSNILEKLHVRRRGEVAALLRDQVIL